MNEDGMVYHFYIVSIFIFIPFHSESRNTWLSILNKNKTRLFQPKTFSGFSHNTFKISLNWNETDACIRFIWLNSKITQKIVKTTQKNFIHTFFHQFHRGRVRLIFFIVCFSPFFVWFSTTPEYYAIFCHIHLNYLMSVLYRSFKFDIRKKIR